MFNGLTNKEIHEIEAEITACEAQLENGQYEEGEDENSTLARKAILSAKLGGYTLYSTNAKCPKCGKLLYTGDHKEYPFLCPVCDENFYNFEVKDIDSVPFKISIPMDAGCYKTNQQRLHQIISNADASFMRYDDEKGRMDIGFFKDDIPSANILHLMLIQIESIQKNRENVQVTVGAVGHGSNGEINGNVMITFEIPNDPRFDFENALYQSAIDYCNTEDGRDAYKFNGGIFNIGDLVDTVPGIYLERNGIRQVSAVAAEELFDLDKNLVDKYDLEDLDDNDDEEE